MGILYLVATPIGNMSDITKRAAQTLADADIIACEDTRVTGSLLKKLDIPNNGRLVSYYEHNAQKRSDFLLSALAEGKNVAVVSDAGTPAISDPGGDIVKKCIENNIEIIPVPGACAFLCGLTASGFSTETFTFAGFLPPKSGERVQKLQKYQNHAETLIFYEAPHRLVKTLADMKTVFSGDRKICLSREISKKFEEHKRVTIDEALEFYESNTVKGEFVIIVEGFSGENENVFDDIPIEEHLNKYINLGMTKKDAIKEVAKDRNIPKRDVYAMVHNNAD